MRDRNALVTRDTTRESQPPVPTRPNPARPALYMGLGEPFIHVVALVTRGAASPSPVASQPSWMGQTR